MVGPHVNDFVHDHLEDAVLVTGLPRSGTTILGKLVGTLDSIEYAFEPPFLAHLDANYRLGSLSRETVSELATVYLYYDYFINFLHGREYNFRPDDASNVLGMQPVPEVLDKWNRVDDTQDALDLAPEYTFSFKFPGVYRLTSALVGGPQNLRIVDIGRNLDRVVASLLDKRWFFDENLGPDSTGLWPFHDHDGAYLVPYIVAEDDCEAWQSMTPESRTVYVANRLASDRLEFRDDHAHRDGYYDLRYEHLVEEPSRTADDLASFLGVSRGQKTESVVSDIAPTSATHHIDDILAECDPEVSERYRELRPAFAY